MRPRKPMYSVVMSSWGQAGRALGQPLPVGPTDAPRTDSTCGGGQLQPSPGSSTLKASVSDRQASGLENNLGSPTCQRRGWVSPSGSEASALAHPPGSLSRRTSGRRRDRPHAAAPTLGDGGHMGGAWTQGHLSPGRLGGLRGPPESPRLCAEQSSGSAQAVGRPGCASPAERWRGLLNLQLQSAGTITSHGYSVAQSCPTL